LSKCRQLIDAPDSELIDRALAALIAEVEADREIAALTAQPYESDPDLAWQVEDGPPLPYSGAIPKEVLDKARARRKRG
jgi:hypothetical protein